MRTGFGCGDKAGADPHPIGSGSQGGRHSPRRADTSGCQHRHIHGFQHLLQQRESADGAVDVAACSNSLGDY
jgi:hypothetical protein